MGKLLQFNHNEERKVKPMLRVNLDNERVLGITWNHSKTVLCKPVANIDDGELESFPLRATYCELYLVNGEDATLIASGVAKCSYLDHFVKETGRKLSLRDALVVAKLDSHDRKMVWEFYLNRRENGSTAQPSSSV